VCGEGGRTYLGRSASRLGSKTEKAVRPLIPAQKSAEGIVGRNAEGPNGPRQGVKGKGK